MEVRAKRVELELDKARGRGVLSDDAHEHLLDHLRSSARSRGGRGVREACGLKRGDALDAAECGTQIGVCGSVRGGGGVERTWEHAMSP